MGRTAIPWVAREGTVARTWNVTRGCTAVSPGCERCYARIYHERFRKHRGLNDWNEPVPLKEKLGEPFGWRDSATVFVCSMSDLFHEAIPDQFIYSVLTQAWDVSEDHTFIFLTKRPARLLDVMRAWHPRGAVHWEPNDRLLPFWVGVTAENQEQADDRIPYLAQIPAAVRFVSCEPLLGPVNLQCWLPGLDWVIVGSESGPGARLMDEDWVRAVRDTCREQVPFFYKQRMSGRRTIVMPELDGFVHQEWPGQKSSRR